MRLREAFPGFGPYEAFSFDQAVFYALVTADNNAYQSARNKLGDERGGEAEKPANSKSLEIGDGGAMLGGFSGMVGEFDPAALAKYIELSGVDPRTKKDNTPIG